MATRKPMDKFFNSTLTFVRGPIFLSIISLVLLVVAIPAQATYLRGYIQQSDAPENEGSLADSHSNQAPIRKTKAATPMHAAAPQVTAAAAELPPRILHLSPQPALPAYIPAQPAPIVRAISAPPEVRRLLDNSFPPTFAGAWKCITVVVDSRVASVPVGQKVESQVSFVQAGDGRVVARWEQPGWTEAQANVVPISYNEANLERINYFIAQGIQRGWSAHSLDRYLKLDANRIAASSKVDQFTNGNFLGQYQTRSMLYRMSDDIAYAR